MENKVKAPLIGADGNIFNLMGIANKSLRNAGVDKEVISEMNNRIYSSDSYEEALGILQEYVEPVSVDDIDYIDNDMEMYF